jgi:hypothetical protein
VTSRTPSHTHHRTCFYCECTYTTARSSVGDHFPVPQRAGGIDTVPCCRSCHDLKDRIPLGSWNAEMLNKVIADFPKLRRETRIFLAKILSLMPDILGDLSKP